ncbi:MAG: UDP-N-acetylmuramoyl-L-alanine--D-glutamate ligase [Burkholderiales bacterium]
MKQLNDQRVLILGLGVSGLAMAVWCARHGADVTVVDTREQPPALAQLTSQVPAARFISAALEASLVEGAGYRAVFASPGLSPSAIGPVMQAASAQGLWCGGELTLFAQALVDLREQENYAPTLLAVTGTNGKTTVTALTGLLVSAAGKDAVVAGNIGPSLLDTLAERLDAGALPEAWVLELSSFQLELAGAFEPTAATVLNLTQDHLDWHGSMDAYVAAKAKVFGQHGLMVLNRDDANVMALPREPAGKKPKAKVVPREVASFGSDVPRQTGDFGIEIANGMAWLVRATSESGGRPDARRRRSDCEEMYIQRLMPAEALRIRGRHNALNALAALALASAAGCSLAPMLGALREYCGEPHRVESIGVIEEVEYFDDSKGTNVGATVAALLGLGAERRLVVILGGDGKGQDFAPLARPVSRHARAVVLIGRDGPLIRSVLEGTGVELIDAASMEQAVELAADHAKPTDAVLMSPACASFDMYRNYEHRAEVFRAAVSTIAHQRGALLETTA